MTTVPKINNVELVSGIEIRFKTHNRVDGQTYTGKVLGLVTYDIAATYADVDAIHANQEGNVAKKQITAQTFLLVRTADDAIRPFALCWIVDDTSFMRTDISTDATIKIFNISTEQLYQLLTYIRKTGFECEIEN